MVMLWLFGILITIHGCSSVCEEDLEEQWSYSFQNGPVFWPKMFQGCAGRQQSPVDIKTKAARKDSNLKRLSFNNYDVPIKNAVVRNNGHTVLVTPQDSVVRSIKVNNVKYQLQQLHFHFGSRSSNGGSEHTVNGQRYLMEGHLVHRNSKGGLAVVGIFFELSQRHSTAFAPIANVLQNVRFSHQSASLQGPLKLNKLVACDPCPIYRYNGSLTTPTCDEGVIWSVVYPNIAKISKSEYLSLLDTYTATEHNKNYKECRMANNFRLLQDLNGRTITKSV